MPANQALPLAFAGGMDQATADSLYPRKDVVQVNTPSTGATVVMTDDSLNGTLYLTPAGTLATLTVTLPTDANSLVGQVRRIASTQILTVLTINGAASILNTVTTLAANAVVTFQKVAANTWIRIS